MKELDLPPENHVVQVVDFHYGENDRIKLECTCLAWWSIAQPKGMTVEEAITRSIGNHLGSLKRPPTKPD